VNNPEKEHSFGGMYRQMKKPHQTFGLILKKEKAVYVCSFRCLAASWLLIENRRVLHMKPAAVVMLKRRLSQTGKRGKGY
jgi:hypothetical protein